MRAKGLSNNVEGMNLAGSHLLRKGSIWCKPLCEPNTSLLKRFTIYGVSLGAHMCRGEFDPHNAIETLPILAC